MLSPEVRWGTEMGVILVMGMCNAARDSSPLMIGLKFLSTGDNLHTKNPSLFCEGFLC